MSDEREIILEAARKRFHDTGIDGVSLEEIAAETKLDIDFVHLHFPEKLALVFIILQEELIKVAEKTMATLPESQIDAQLKHQLEHRFTFFVDHQSSAAQVMREVFFSNEGWRETYDNMLWRFSIGVVALLQAAKRRGEIRQDVDETVAARAYVSYYLTGMMMICRGEVKTAEAICDFTFPLVDALVTSLK